MWRGGFRGAHRHVANTQARWVKGPVVLGRAPEDRQRRTVGLGPLWTGEGPHEPLRLKPPGIQLYNAWPKRWGEAAAAGRHTPESSLCICHTAIPRGEVELFRGGSRSRKRNAPARPATAVARETAAARPDRSMQSVNVQQLRESHLGLLDAAQQASGSADPALRDKARFALEGRLLAIDSAIAACAALRARARVEEYGRRCEESVGDDAIGTL
jgi:hypothetical protein